VKDISIVFLIRKRNTSVSQSIQDEEGKLKYKLRFLDSFKFIASSLDKLVNNLKPEQFENIKRHFDVNLICC